MLNAPADDADAAVPGTVAFGNADGEDDEPSASLLDLDDDRATDPTIAGGKAAALATVRRAGGRTLPGLILSTELSRAIDRGADLTELGAIDQAFAFAARHWEGRPVIARSSSVVEDQTATSAAGQFESVADISDIAGLRDAVRTVLDSRTRAGATDQPIAVLLQPQVTPDAGGVLFGVDPVSGRSDRRVVTAVVGRPDALVGGEVEGSRFVTDDVGAIIDADLHDGPQLSADTVRSLVGLADRLGETFGAPQDIEWAIVGDDLVVLQSRPVTTEIRGVPQGPVYGPGTVAETFPDPLTSLERDLWIPPLQDALREALVISGRWRRTQLEGRPLVITVDGRAAIDWEMTAGTELHQGDVQRRWLNDRIARLRTAWRIGRLRAALPHLVDDLVARVDDDLTILRPLEQLTNRQLIALLERAREALCSVHAYETLSGVLSESEGGSFTGASLALRVLVEMRGDGLTDTEIIERAPVVLALTAPRIGPWPELPAAQPGTMVDDAPHADEGQLRRETLRLRVRWLHELTARAAWQLGRRLEEAGHIGEAATVRHLDYDTITAVVERRACLVAEVVEAERERAEHGTPGPLPTRFQVSDRGRPIRVDDEKGSEGTGAGGGRVEGTVTHDTLDPAEGAVLVVDSLSPGLSTVLGRVGGIVAETGSVLSHLAILAREQGVAVVVGRRDALDELTEGTRVVIDGDAGTIEIVDTVSGDVTDEGDEPGSTQGEERST